ncbi:hypothetical protein EROM_051200 [Encephalitozoon romaleae SJ-2008]|uniref:Uncharacterized protein n=1 Tax=Encephalitozoon romaleae (strain SJ-2008) TaxID=1178016 RepID=I6ZTQ4_ENCRO|nr:hypothetical protein EROM_051200 [Encephalitozoon romaleae SJ-2008]AFN83051.1 hypothetical protein EROM_051200 [Encephalitozoon romaleae SJ-2008]
MEFTSIPDFQELNNVGSQIVIHNHSALLMTYSLLVAIRSLLECLSYQDVAQFSLEDDIKSTFTNPALFDRKIMETIEKTETNIDELLKKTKKWVNSIGLTVYNNVELNEFQEFPDFRSKVYPYFIFSIHNPQCSDARMVWEKLYEIVIESRRSLNIYDNTGIWKELIKVKNEMLESKEIEYLTKRVFLSAPVLTPLRLMDGVEDILNGKYNEWIFPYLELCGLLSLLSTITSPR